MPVVPAAGVVTIGLIGYCLYEWLSNAAYGVNNNDSLIYMGAMYVLALVIYLVARVIRAPPGHRPLPDQQGDPGRVAAIPAVHRGPARDHASGPPLASIRPGCRIRIIRQAVGASSSVVSSKSP